MKKIAVLACALLVFSMSMAIDDLGKDRIYRKPSTDPGSDKGNDDTSKTCTTVYYRTCSGGSCISSTAAGACCGDCRNSGGFHAPCNACSAN